ncbi:hypothetical protein DFH07DRAFT_958298 [Mycena maculata]|uniref:Uncharacterized protein n=1 Tax=Mycena maculata TaxID=230809 RepID=A0AAD7J749_9AGAR|nr:hypothetical protein DFH07DRAFT_958298 [Mycena maculata]
MATTRKETGKARFAMLQQIQDRRRKRETDSLLKATVVDPQKGERHKGMDYVLGTPRKKKDHAAEYRDSPETLAMADVMLVEYYSRRRDHLADYRPVAGESESSEEEYDPNSTLPYIPRLKISKRRVNAFLLIHGTIARLEAKEKAAATAARLAARLAERARMKAAMSPVFAQIVDVGAARKSTQEVGPAVTSKWGASPFTALV